VSSLESPRWETSNSTASPPPAGTEVTSRPTGPTITTDEEALDAARGFAAIAVIDATERDQGRRSAQAAVDRLSALGLLGVTVPARYGGAEVRTTTLAEIFRTLAEADSAVAQIPHSHFVFLEVLRLQGDEGQQARFFAEALAGRLFANGQVERHSRMVSDDATTLSPRRDGTYVLSGEKYYCTGARFADWLAIRAKVEGGARASGAVAIKAVAYIRRDSTGVTVVDDWNALGQRATASGTITLDHVVVPSEQIVPYTAIFEGPTVFGARAQLLHAAIDAGIARGAARAAVDHVGRARPWFESGVDHAVDDPLLIQQAGELEIDVRAAEALLREAGECIDDARTNLSEQSAAAASVTTAIAKVACARAATEASSMLFDLAGTRATADVLNLSRYWRDARTHTLHDPVRWKVQHIGRWLLSGTRPPRHGQI
jgi:SfnB family sulfur acquisition oxidoreductase